MEPNKLAMRLSGLTLLVGAGVIAALGVAAWPWFLIVLALSMLPAGFSAGGFAGMLILLLWVGGMLIAASADLFWPGVIVLLVLSLVLRMYIGARRARIAAARDDQRTQRRRAKKERQRR